MGALRCPNCGFQLSSLQVAKGIASRRQRCVSCQRKYSLASPSEINPFIDFDVALIGLLVTVFVESWLLWALVMGVLVGLLFVRHVDLVTSASEATSSDS
jgi:uncharacterized protein (DUF983 family)